MRGRKLPVLFVVVSIVAAAAAGGARGARADEKADEAAAEVAVDWHVHGQTPGAEQQALDLSTVPFAFGNRIGEKPAKFKLFETGDALRAWYLRIGAQGKDPHRWTKVDSVRAFPAEEAKKTDALGKVLPHGGTLVVLADSTGKREDVLEIYVNPDGKVAAACEVER